ncbi:calcium-translocating P-type ATPase, PMCA-type family protein [Histomonas meleagridis]|uniref:calcium-translocating P-type ATPase, PMCA-type family protein n=1 Tax=Histomonas meleagridis TaxID=135588 RepID=UPI003559498E|nr:calcium-translocating P-type ATPase, PMCA-type family protein [Histomonas meleagridis]KAH0802662.1 calcium-translocating P-type ATPase, PMCA-type family protein [Histomonas meleagridis]
MDLSASELSSLIESGDTKKIHELGNVNGVAKKINSDVENGLKKNSISSQKSKYGTNELPEKEVSSFFDMLIEALNDQTLLILISCAIFSLIFEVIFASPEERSTSWIDGAAILMAVVIVSFVQAYSNHKQELQFASVNRIKSIFDVVVIRDSDEIKIKNTDVVVGDVVLLEAGDKIPADGLLIKSYEMKVDQSVTSGESEAVDKDENDPFLYSGNHVVEGRGTFLVLCVGPNSQSGKMFSLLENEQKLTPLQERLEDLAKNIGYVGMLVASLTFIALTVGWLLMRIKYGFTLKSLKDVLTYLINALTIIVVAVPEGLPLAVTISLAYSMRKMMSDNNFVRHLYACETMGNATIICTDKTGTLTMNQMNVERVIIGDKDINVNELDENVNDKYKETLMESIAINTTGYLSADGTMIGSQTEAALLRLIKQLNGNITETRKENPIIKSFQFDRNRKRMSTIITKQNKYISYVKGANETILDNCTSYLDSNCNVHPLNKETKDIISSISNNHCNQAYRLLAICYKDLETIPNDSNESESNLTLICIVSIRDSLRPSTKQSINDCQNAGIRVIMITGDNLITAKAIAKECGIITEDEENENIVTGSELRNLNEKQLIERLSTVNVIARSTPMDKHMIVSALHNNGEIVAVTGDGTNDAAALMKADVGLSMGKCGTELAKEASDIVILDDDFKSIIKSVIWGRCIFNNVRRFLQFQLTANIVTLFISFVSAIILNDSLFKAVQMLWINLIMDSLGALALATGKPHPSLLKRNPSRRNEPLISMFMIQNILGQCIFQIIVVALLLIFNGDIEKKSLHHYTLVFNVFVYCQMFNLVNARVVDRNDSLIAGIGDNTIFLVIMFGIGVVEFVLVQYFGNFFACAPLTLEEQFRSLVIAALCIPFGALFRKIPTKVFAAPIRKMKMALKRFLRLFK